MRAAWLGVAVLACGCGAPSVRDAGPPAGAGAPRRDICEGVGEEMCQDRVLLQSLCLVGPDDPGCAELRASGWLPPAPPPLTELQGCWRVDEHRDDLPTTWWCLGERDVAVRNLDGWDVWPLGGWHREDSTRVAGWSATLASGRRLWLTVLDTAPLVLQLSDGAGLVGATLMAGDPGLRGEAADARAALTSPDVVCRQARECQAAFLARVRRRHPIPLEQESEGEAGFDPTAGATTLRECERARADVCPQPAPWSW